MNGPNGHSGPGGQHGRDEQEGLIPKHGGYRKLKSFQVSQLVYDVTVQMRLLIG